MQYERKVYLLTRHDDIGYDETIGFVCIASNVKEARELGETVHGDQNKDVWKLNTTRVSVIGHTDRPKGIIMTSFNAG